MSGYGLCTERVAKAAGDLELRALGAVRFKNVPYAVSLVEVFIGATGDEVTGLDPVCRMQVALDTAPARLPYGGQTYVFCSFECAKRFTESPDAYIME